MKRNAHIRNRKMAAYKRQIYSELDKILSKGAATLDIGAKWVQNLTRYSSLYIQQYDSPLVLTRSEKQSKVAGRHAQRFVAEIAGKYRATPSSEDLWADLDSFAVSFRNRAMEVGE